MKTQMLAIAVVLLAASGRAQPQGQILVSVSLEPIGSGLYDIPVTGGPAREVISTSGITSYTSPDAPPLLGSEFVTVHHAPGSSEVYVMDRTGRIVRTVATAGLLTGSVDDPAVSFGANRIAYVHQSNIAVLCVCDYDGTGLASVYTSADPNVTFFDPCFTPDGQSLGFVLRNRSAGTRFIYSVPVTGGTAQQVPGTPDGADHPAYSPDGRWLAYVARTGGMTQLFVAASNGSAARQVTFPPENAVHPAFSPDSRYIVAGSYDGLIIVDLSNDTVIQRISTVSTQFYGITWHMGAEPSAGMIVKAKVKPRKLLVKTRNVLPASLPAQALVVIDGVSVPFADAALWQSPNGKKSIIYKDKALKRKVKLVLKNGKGIFAAKRLELVEGQDYRVDETVAMGLNCGSHSIVGTIDLDRKGKYNAPK
jgi:hypothetical protein